MKSSRFGVFLAMAAIVVLFNNYSAAAADPLCLKHCMAACNDLDRRTCVRDCDAFCAAEAPPPKAADVAAEEDVFIEDGSCFKTCFKECNSGLVDMLQVCQRDCQARCAHNTPPTAEFAVAEAEAETETETEAGTEGEDPADSCFKKCMAECNFRFHCIRDCEKRCRGN